MKTTLNKISKNEKCVVLEVNGEKSIKRKIFDMGITPGTTIIFKKIAPLGDPIEINLRGYSLSIRKNIAEKIIVEKHK